MRKGDFSLEILVDNEVLPEYEVPLSEKAKLTRSRENETTTYVAVPYSSYHFCIRVGVHSTLGSMVYKGIHYVDGQNDDTYMELNPLNDDPYTYIYGFYNYDKTIFHKFKFDANRWTEDEIFVSNLPIRCTKSPCDKKELGLISVYIFTAERLHGKRLMSQGKNNQGDFFPETPDLLDNIDPRDIICLEEPQEEPMPNLRATSKKPIAELHIRYQTKEWLRNNLIGSSDNSLASPPYITLFENQNSDDSDGEIVTSEQSEQSEEITDDTDDDSMKEFLAKINEEPSPTVVIGIYNSDEEMENFGNNLDKIEEGSPNYGAIGEFPNEQQVEDKTLDKGVVRAVRKSSLGYEVESEIKEDVGLAANEGLNERIKDISISDKRKGNGTFVNDKDEVREDLMVIDRNEFEMKVREFKFIDLTVESPKDIIEISDNDDDDDDGVILVETVKSFLSTTVNKKKHRNKKIKYYSDSSIDWNNDDDDDDSNCSGSSSEDEFITISKKRLRT